MCRWRLVKSVRRASRVWLWAHRSVRVLHVRLYHRCTHYSLFRPSHTGHSIARGLCGPEGYVAMDALQQLRTYKVLSSSPPPRTGPMGRPVTRTGTGTDHRTSTCAPAQAPAPAGRGLRGCTRTPARRGATRQRLACSGAARRAFWPAAPGRCCVGGRGSGARASC